MTITAREAIDNGIWEEVRTLHGIDNYALQNGMSDQMEFEISMHDLINWGVISNEKK